MSLIFSFSTFVENLTLIYLPYFKKWGGSFVKIEELLEQESYLKLSVVEIQWLYSIITYNKQLHILLQHLIYLGIQLSASYFTAFNDNERCRRKEEVFWLFKWRRRYPVDIYLLKVNNRNTRTRCEICSKLTIKTPERRQ